jgi:ABC-type multidrug transport system fused ATPase/permease subunit
MKIKFKTIKNLGYLIKRKNKALAIFTFVITLAGILEAFGIGVLYPIMNVLEDHAKRAEYLGWVNDLSFVHLTETSFIYWLFGTAFVLFLLRGASVSFSYYTQYKLTESLRINFQTTIFGKYMDREYDYFVKHRTGDLIQKQMTHTEMAGDAILYSCQIARNLFPAACLYVTLCIVSLTWTMWLTAIMAVLTLAALIVSKVKIYTASQEHANLQKRAYSIAVETITGIRQVKAFLAEKFFQKHFNDAVTRKARIYTKNATLGHMPTPVMQTCVLLGVVVGLFLAFRHEGNITGLLPLVVVFGGASYRIISSMAGVSSNFMQIAHLLPSVNIVADLLRLEPAHEKLPGMGRFEKDIVFENVDFAYAREGFRLSGIDLTFEKGKFYGIVGSSGSGKSTLIDLIMKFYSNEDGNILVDGKDLKGIDVRSWRGQIGLISQETFIFNGTIEENISFATDESEVVKDRVIAAAKTADIHDFITELPDGFQTVVGERGLTLSGGQRQRLAIARAVYRDPEVYIFDEATSSLDTHSEKRIQKAIEDLSRSKTVIAVAHRLSTVVYADEIIAMDGGRIVEKGTHSALLEKEGFYAGLHTHQHATEEREKEEDAISS